MGAGQGSPGCGQLTPGPRPPRYLLPSLSSRSRVLVTWMCQSDSEVAMCSTMMLTESTCTETS